MSSGCNLQKKSINISNFVNTNLKDKNELNQRKSCKIKFDAIKGRKYIRNIAEKNSREAKKSCESNWLIGKKCLHFYTCTLPWYLSHLLFQNDDLYDI